MKKLFSPTPAIDIVGRILIGDVSMSEKRFELSNEYSVAASTEALFQHLTAFPTDPPLHGKLLIQVSSK